MKTTSDHFNYVIHKHKSKWSMKSQSLSSKMEDTSLGEIGAHPTKKTIISPSQEKSLSSIFKANQAEISSISKEINKWG